MTGGGGSERTERVFHVVVLSNFARAYDKYLRAYRKSLIPESRHPGVVHVLAEHELPGTARHATTPFALEPPGWDQPPGCVSIGLSSGRTD